MLTWNVTYHCKKGQREAFYQALCELGIRASSLAEAGNCRYDYYFAAEAPDDLLLVESWTSPALQQAHRLDDALVRSQYADHHDDENHDQEQQDDLPDDGTHIGDQQLTQSSMV